MGHDRGGGVCPSLAAAVGPVHLGLDLPPQEAATLPQDDAGQTAAATVTEIYAHSPTPLRLRDRASIQQMFLGFDLLEPGLVPADQWRPDPEQPHLGVSSPDSFLGGVGHLPLPPAVTSHGQQRGRKPNNLLRQARLRAPSPAAPNRSLSRQELAEAVNAWVYDHTGQVTCLDEQHIRRYEAGHCRNPCPSYRQALRAILHVGNDEALGFI
ncbi:MAG: hypothetical protein HKP61_12835 [Dactylosporangium sp.]|nr:hypothetical protein [Dactylosporangium sp.]